MNDKAVVIDIITDEEKKEIEVKIVHLLGVYPVISPTMLQGGLGPAVKPALWRPVLAGLIEAGIVEEEFEPLMTPSDRHNTYHKLRLAQDNDS